jgi:hypothetical protein
MGRADWAIVTGWQKLLLGAALCLPIPALSISGLTLPLPTAVYQVAIAIVESTQELAGVLRPTDADRDARPRAQAALSPRPQRARPVASRRRAAARTAPVRASARPLQSADAAARALVVPSGKQPSSPRPRPRGVRAQTVPATGATNAAADVPVTTAAPAPGPEVRNERPPTDPTLPRGDVAPVEHAPIEPQPIAPAPQPPPAPEPRVLEPVKETVKPVIDLVEPVKEPLKPVTDTVDRLGVPRP